MAKIFNISILIMFTLAMLVAPVAASFPISVVAKHSPDLGVKFPDCNKAAKDLNKDGLYEDVNGNGMLDFNDIVVFSSSIYNTQFWNIHNKDMKKFNFDGDKNRGKVSITFSDVMALYNMI